LFQVQVVDSAEDSHTEEEARELFDTIDKEGKGHLDLTGIKAVYEQLGEALGDEEAEQMMKDASP
jgi:Ca2+-binding EF-hand superfamily protein